MCTSLALVPAPGGGWIGDWSPGIGDPTAGGWLTVVLYVLAAGLVARVVRGRRVTGDRERWFWSGLFVALLCLGINKQLDLQSAFTELGRIVFRQSGLYEARREAQRLFIEGMGVAAVAAGFGLVWLVRGTPRPTKLALWGAVALSAFVVVRAASFHHIDLFIGASLLGVRLNWILEMGSLVVVAVGAHQRYAAGAPRR